MRHPTCTPRIRVSIEPVQDFRFMFHSLATVSTLLTMLFHSIFGCCWHHVHAMVSPTNIAASNEHSKCSGHGRRESREHECHELQSPCGSVPEHPGSPEIPCCPRENESPCGEDECTFVVSEVVKVDFSNWELLPDRAYFATSEPAQSCSSQDKWLLLGIATPGVLSPRARSQVWII